MIFLLMLLAIGVWVALLYGAGYFLSFFIKPKWIRHAIGLAVLIGLFTLPLRDEMEGAKEFRKLCMDSAAMQIVPTEPGKKFDLRYSITDGPMLKNFALPTQEQFTKYTDASTGQVIATGKTYTLYGGRMVRFIGQNPMGTGNKPLLSESTCAVFHQDHPANSRLRDLSNLTTK
jgi:hypothetical protein